MSDERSPEKEAMLEMIVSLSLEITLGEAYDLRNEVQLPR